MGIGPRGEWVYIGPRDVWVDIGPIEVCGWELAQGVSGCALAHVMCGWALALRSVWVGIGSIEVCGCTLAPRGMLEGKVPWGEWVDMLDPCATGHARKPSVGSWTNQRRAR